MGADTFTILQMKKNEAQKCEEFSQGDTGTQGRGEDQREAACSWFVLTLFFLLTGLRTGYCEYHFSDEKMKALQSISIFLKAIQLINKRAQT